MGLSERPEGYNPVWFDEGSIPSLDIRGDITVPITEIDCPNCGHPLHTDCLLEARCTVVNCGEEFDAAFYEENDVNNFYNPYLRGKK